MSGALEPDPVEGIREVFGAYKLLTTVSSNSDLGFVITHLSKVFEGESEGTGRAMESKALSKLKTVFKVYRTLNKWDPEAAVKILVENLEQILESSDASKTKEESPELIHVKQEDIKIDDVASTTTIITTTTTEKADSDSTPTFFSSSASTVIPFSPSRLDPVNEEDSNYEADARDNDEASSDISTIDICAKMNLSAKETIRKAIETTLQESGSPYTVTSKEKKYLCHLCYDKEYGWLQLLAQHLWGTHGEPPHFNCPHPQCLATYRSPTGFSHHVKKIHVNGRVQGRTPNSVKAPSGGRRHVKKSLGGHTRVKKSLGGHTRVKKSSAVSTTLGKSKVQKLKKGRVASTGKLKLKSKLKAAKLQKVVRRGARKRIYVCPYCEESFNFAGGLKIHIRVHTGEKPYSCEHCDNQFARKYHLTCHLRIRNRRFPCRFDRCCRSFNKADSRDRHESGRTHRSEAAPNNADNNNSTSDRDDPRNSDNVGDSDEYSEEEEKGEEDEDYVPQQKLKLEMLRIGGGFKCSLCTSQFFTKALLGSHMRKEHADPVERPYPCSFCGERFKSRGHCSDHVRSKHTRSGLHNCAHCPRKFRSAQTLSFHLQTHLLK